jgi:type VI secretion system secreted protein Hcp
MKTPRNQARIAVGAGALTAVLGLSILAFAGDVGLRRASTDAMRALGNPPISPAALQAAIYVKFEGAEGESTDAAHKGWSNALSFRQGQSLPVSRAAGGAAASRAAFEDILITKELDKASPRLAEAACKGRILAKVEIHVTRTLGAGSATYYKYEIKNVIISSYHVRGTSQAVPVDEIALNFEEIKVTYTEQDATGKSKGNVEYSWKV